MSLKLKVWTLVDIALRVPPIFLIDTALKYGVKATTKSENSSSLLDLKLGNQSEIHRWSPIIEDIGISVFWTLLYIQVFFTALLVFLFSTKQLILIYIRVASVFIIVTAYELNTSLVNLKTRRLKQSQPNTICLEAISNHVLLLILAIVFSFTNTANILPHSVVWVFFFAPLLTCTLSVPLPIVKFTPLLSAIVCGILLAYSVWLHGLQVCETIYKGVTWCHSVVENYGLYTMIETHWLNLHIPQVFRAYWLIRLSEYIINTLHESGFASLSISDLFKGIILHGSENIITLFGMTSIISFMCQFSGEQIQVFLRVNDPKEKNIGGVTALLFLILSIQSGVTSLDPNERYNRIIRNLCLLFTALLHFVYNIVNPMLISLSASKNPSIGDHIRALVTSAILIISSAIILKYQWNTQNSSTWIYAITSFMIELIIKSSVSLTIYTLFTIDAYKNGLWENLDDYIYYLKVTIKVTEFLIGIYLLLNGLWIFLFESTGMIRACMMCLHAYFNIWIQGKKGWESYVLRNSALKRINFLQIATREQLLKKKDVCAICFQELNSARITHCNHFFHGICLRKWLNVQNSCPLCHSSLCKGNNLRC
ncbi:protein TRC8 homolog [Parasteatoda tepidariorum]|uniref:protein TRC8 homolog n=1 Tax=Parasteatoda tepidariorum TaxID=114398 RepID=UPI00077FAC3E|nr:protein TRC8 homolog [Parasteatoda tepidariorum]